jgi:hypothetical protein
VIKRLHEMGVRSEQAYWAGAASIGLAILAWASSLRAGSGDLSRADRWGIFVGEWAPTFFALGNGLRSYEAHEELARTMVEPGTRRVTEPVP